MLGTVPTSSVDPRSAPPAPTSDIPHPTSFSPTDLALLDSLLTHGLSPPHLSAAINAPLSTLDILAWATQPHIAAHLAALRQLANTAATLRLARARFDAIDALARLTSHQDPTTQRLAATTLLKTTRRRASLPAAGRSEIRRGGAGVGLASEVRLAREVGLASDPAHATHSSTIPPRNSGSSNAADPPLNSSIPLQAEGLIGLSRGWSAGSASDRSDTPGSPAPNPPYPEGVLGASSTKAPHDPQRAAPAPSAPSAPSALPLPTASTPESLLAELEALTRRLNDDTTLDEELDAELESEAALDDPGGDARSGSDIRHRTSDIPGLPPLSAQEEAEGKLALEFFQSLKVPLSHPDIIDALAQGRLHDLPQIADQIRASRAPP